MKRRINFFAKRVVCSEALDYEIQQVCFSSSAADEDHKGCDPPYLIINVNYEFSNTPGAQWSDGENFSESNSITEVERTRSKAVFESADGMSFDVSFDLSDDGFQELEEYLNRIVPKKLKGDNAKAETTLGQGVTLLSIHAERNGDKRRL